MLLRLKTQLEGLVSNLPIQTIHRDLNPENILNDRNRYGFVDFDITENNICIFDICYCATAILSETFNNNSCNNDKWFDILHNIIKGYEDIIKLTQQEKQAIPYIVCSIQIMCINDFSKQEKHKDSAKTNIKILEFIIAKIFQL